MKQESVQYFTEKEEEVVKLLIEIGTKKNVAKVLVFLANIPEATSHTIERGIDLRQPEVSISMHYLMDQGWITCRESKTDGLGRPVKIYKLAKPISEIMDSFEKETENRANNQLKLIKRLQDYIP
jgi:predicted transcriptional regulator